MSPLPYVTWSGDPADESLPRGTVLPQAFRSFVVRDQTFLETRDAAEIASGKIVPNPVRRLLVVGARKGGTAGVS